MHKGVPEAEALLTSRSGHKPTVRRRRLIAELRRLREASGKTIDEVANSIGMSKSAISRIETGLVNPKLPILRSLITEYRVPPDQAAVLEQLAREAAQRGWWQSGAPLVPDATKTLIGLEAEARWVNHFGLSVITGLLQTPKYAEAILRVNYPDATREEIDALVGVRIRRQERLPELRVWVITAEEALTRPIGGPGVMRAQIERLIAASDEPRMTIQVLARESGAHPGLAGPFTILGFDQSDPEVVYVEGQQWDACIEEPELVETYIRHFDILRALALSPGESLNRLQQRAKEFK